jgi:transcriptional regulator with XRE-family HTH domain
MPGLTMIGYEGALGGAAPTKENLGGQLRAARERMHMTRAALGAALGVSAETIAKWEQGQRTPRSRMGAVRRFLQMEPPPIPVPRQSDAVGAVKVMSSEQLWLLHDEVDAELKRRFELATERINTDRLRGAPLPLPEEARMAVDRDTQHLP